MRHHIVARLDELLARLRTDQAPGAGHYRDHDGYPEHLRASTHHAG